MELSEMEYRYKSELCPTFESSRSCPDGSECAFAHGLKELRSTENPLYKTQICTAYEQEGRCRLGDHCLFAHGEDEVRELALPSASSSLPRLTRTPELQAGNSQMHVNGENNKVCNFFLKYGNCTKGDNCRYSHVKSGNIVPMQSLSQSATGNSSEPKANDAAKFKTRMCVPYQYNKMCTNKDNCTFAHDESELRQTESQKGSDRPGFMKKEDYMYKTMLCKNYEQKGSCIVADMCRFAHGRFELRPRGFKGDFEEKVKQNPNWKCSLCDIYKREGNCSRAECNYAHGEGELRSSRKAEMPDKNSSRYKTAICKDWSNSGVCRNGGMCNFAHGEQELRGNKQGAGAASMMSLGATELFSEHNRVASQMYAYDGSFPGMSKGSDMGMHMQSAMQGMAMQARKRPFEPSKQTAVAEMSLPQTTVSPDMKMFAEFLEFKKFKQQTEEISACASSPSLSNNYPAVVSPSTGGMGGARAPMMGYPERNQYSYDFY